MITDITLNIQNYADATATFRAFQGSAGDISFNEKIVLRQQPGPTCISFMQVKSG